MGTFPKNVLQFPYRNMQVQGVTNDSNFSGDYGDNDDNNDDDDAEDYDED